MERNSINIFGETPCSWHDFRYTGYREKKKLFLIFYEMDSSQINIY